MDETDTATTGTAAATPDAPASNTDAIVDGWFADHFPGSIVAQTTEVWNHVHAAVAELKRRLAAG